MAGLTLHITPEHEQSFVNGLFFQPWYYTTTDLHVSVSVRTSTSSLMRPAKIPVDSTPSTRRKRGRQEEKGGREGRRGEKQYKKKKRGAVESGEAFWAEQKLTGPLGWPDQILGPQRALTTRAPHACYGKAGATGGTPRATLHKCGVGFTMRSGCLVRKHVTFMSCFEGFRRAEKLYRTHVWD